METNWLEFIVDFLRAATLEIIFQNSSNCRQMPKISELPETQTIVRQTER